MLVGGLCKRGPAGMERLRQWVDPSINAAAQPKGADAISELLLLESILVMLRRVLVTNAFPVPGFPSTKTN